jgi:hypothetical protein
MKDQSGARLTDMEKRVFGENARRLPDGTVEETGIGSVAHFHASRPVNASADFPLSKTEKLVFGHNATRRPDGSVRELGSSHDPHVVAHRRLLDERAAAAAKPERVLDVREVHDFHPTRQ